MNDTRVAKRYAAALFDLAEKDGIVDAVTQDLSLIERFLDEVPYLRAVLMQPLVAESLKFRVIEEAFGDRVTATSLSFLRLLIRKRREDNIGSCIQRFRMLLAERNNVLEAVVSSRAPLTAAQQDKLVQGLERRTGKSIALTLDVDPEILGGVIIRLGDKMIDGSVRGRLKRLEQQLLGKRLPGDTH